MVKVVLLCGAGMSTSLLVTKIREAAKTEGLEIDIDAYSVAQYQTVIEGADVVLLGPQIRYELDKVASKAKCPVEVIDMRAYGMMNGPEVIKQIKNAISK